MDQSGEHQSLENWGTHIGDRVLAFPAPSLDLAFDDKVIEDVRAAWKLIMGDGTSEQFMKFEDREDIGEASSDGE